MPMFPTFGGCYESLVKRKEPSDLDGFSSTGLTVSSPNASHTLPGFHKSGPPSTHRCWDAVGMLYADHSLPQIAVLVSVFWGQFDFGESSATIVAMFDGATLNERASFRSSRTAPRAQSFEGSTIVEHRRSKRELEVFAVCLNSRMRTSPFRLVPNLSRLRCGRQLVLCRTQC